MRQIGTLPSSVDPQIFGDYLLSRGITSRAMEDSEGWAIWVHDENKVAEAREEISAYLASPGDERYRAARHAAEEVRREQARLDQRYRKNLRDMRGRWSGPQARQCPLTFALIGACVGVYLAGSLSPRFEFWLWDHLGFFSLALSGSRDQARGLDDILRRGQVWRLLSPMFLHVNLVHLAFNVWATYIEGTLIETRRGAWTLAVLVFFTSLASNVGQFLFVINFNDTLRGWGGISGVGFGLFGYLWMKGRAEPEQGMMLHPSSVRLMLIWLILGLTGIIPSMANGAHLVGLVVGMLFGLARF